jgi:hypothetical protein
MGTDTTWERRRSGLFVPAGHPAGEPLSGAEPHRSTRSAEHRGVWIQAWATVLAVVIALSGLPIAYFTLREQQRINEAQLAVSTEQLVRSKRRYVERVTYWDTPVAGSAEVTVRVDNRSSARLNGVAVVDGSPLGIWHVSASNVVGDNVLILGAVPPCSSVTVRVPAVQDKIGTQGRPWHSVAVSLVDPVTAWAIDDFGTQEGSLPIEPLPSWRPSLDGVASAAWLLSWVYGMPGVFTVDTDRGSVHEIMVNSLPDCGESA